MFWGSLIWFGDADFVEGNEQSEETKDQKSPKVFQPGASSQARWLVGILPGARSIDPSDGHGDHPSGKSGSVAGFDAKGAEKKCWKIGFQWWVESAMVRLNMVNLMSCFVYFLFPESSTKNYTPQDWYFLLFKEFFVSTRNESTWLIYRDSGELKCGGIRFPLIWFGFSESCGHKWAHLKR